MSIKSGVSSATLVERRRQPFCEGWVEHKAHTQGGVRYRKLYMLLEQNVIYIFEKTPPCSQNQLGNLTLEKGTRFRYIGPTNDHSAYKFDLFAGGRLNRFKTVRLSELERWRGYIEGIVTRTVPGDLDLLEDQVRRIEADVRGYYSESDSGYMPDEISVRRGGAGDAISGGLGSGGVSIQTDVTAFSPSSGSGGSGNGYNQKLDNGGPVMVHRFNPDKFGDQTPPSWFMTRCSRATAETVLQAAERLGYGNTLLRESTTHISTGSYVISKLVRDKQTNGVQFDHYEVIRVAGGYQIKVENKHEPMTCLTEVMHYFQRTCGRGTVMLTTNDRRKLQVEAQEEPSYVTRFPRPASQVAVQDHVEPEPDYDDHGPAPPSWSKGSSSRQPQVEGGGSVVMRDRRLSGAMVGSRQIMPPSLEEEVRFRTLEQEGMAALDKVIEGELQTDREYVNVTQELGGRCVPPPMPHMHHSMSAPGYVNQEMDQEVKEAQTLPVAPPPPRDPIVKGGPQASPYPHTSSLRSTKSFSGPASPRDDKPSQLEQSLANVTLRKTGNKPASSASPLQQQQAYRSNVSKSVNTVIKSPDSPNNFPVWEKSQTNVLKTNVPQAQEVPNMDVPSASSTTSGVDGRAPGGVGTLLKRFEVQSNSQSLVSEKTVVKKAPQRVRLTESALRSPCDQYEVAETTSPVPRGGQTTVPRNDHDKKVQFQQQEQRSVDIPSTGSVGRLRERRQSEPAMSAQNIKQRLEGLNPEFKNRLENMIGVSKTVAAPRTSQPSFPGAAPPGAGSRGRPLPPTPNGEPHDHIYEALPENHIPPDEVTYYNDSGHGSM
ncbi:uncharacterized protein LOC128227185 isoform X2 [Mya arenaria]|uniref:uncharacterized protein LOC128227185 isoform X2 n=1 Tax=Mya arenaria TaxID=6604 RepID=UPI0022E3687B|nr:uncharacterized protein LOC128227185 isoform X2 [Mya arenaria]